jgi:hypothetical protein
MRDRVERDDDHRVVLPVGEVHGYRAIEELVGRGA